MQAFTDKVAVITGAASGIGRALAERCVHEGMHVVLADMDGDALTTTAQALHATGARVLAVVTDVAKAQDVDALAQQTLATFGAVHLLCNNAGVWGGISAWDSPLAEWEWVLGVNLWGVIHGLHTFVPLMLAQDTDAHIVNTASLAGLLTGRGPAAYRVSKHAVVALSEMLYHQLAPRTTKVKVSVLCPGGVDTPLLDATRPRPAHVPQRSAPPSRRGGCVGRHPARAADRDGPCPGGRAGLPGPPRQPVLYPHAPGGENVGAHADGRHPRGTPTDRTTGVTARRAGRHPGTAHGSAPGRAAAPPRHTTGGGPMDPDRSAPPIDCTGSVAIVTGGGRGLGRAFAQALAAAGAQVVVTARTTAQLTETAELIANAGGAARALLCDVSVPDDVARLVTTAEQWGPIDLLVNNAGVAGPLGTPWDVDPAAWWRTFEVKMRGAFLCARAVLPGMLTRQRGRIVNISSGAAVRWYPALDAYCASKAALTQWTRCLARETQPHGITVFAFAPGTVRTAGTDYLATAPEVPQALGELVRARLREGRDTPIARAVQMLLFLVSGRADALSGRHIRVQEQEDDLVRRAAEIQREDLHVLTLRT
jgi:NAD(P)-dependent dehydrogenase (short-subunit alcohol dehydrogenase family)